MKLVFIVQANYLHIRLFLASRKTAISFFYSDRINMKSFLVSIKKQAYVHDTILRTVCLKTSALEMLFYNLDLSV